MKKYIILACLLFASIAVGQEEPPPTDEPDEGSAVVGNLLGFYIALKVVNNKFRLSAKQK